MTNALKFIAVIGVFVISCMFSLYGCNDDIPVYGAYPKTGLASWYTSKHTASGEAYNEKPLSCALRKRDFGKYYRVCNLENNKCVVVRHNNFGPSRAMFNKGRIIDLSREAFLRIADLEDGVIRVNLEEK